MDNLQVGDLIPIGAVGNALARHVLTPFTFSSETEGTDVKGTMQSVPSRKKILTKQGDKIFIDEGYHNGSGSIETDIINLTAPNIVKDIIVGGVKGTAQTVEIITKSLRYTPVGQYFIEFPKPRPDIIVAFHNSPSSNNADHMIVRHQYDEYSWCYGRYSTNHNIVSVTSTGYYATVGSQQKLGKIWFIYIK